jgi:hypothetical protein
VFEEGHVVANNRVSMGDILASPLEPTLWLARALLGLALYLLCTAALLNRLFEAGRLVSWYGFNLFLLLVLGYGLLLLSVALAYDILFVVVMATDILPVLAPVFVPAGFLLAVTGLWGTVRSLFAVGRAISEHVPVWEDQEPALWQVSMDAAAAVGARPADRIVLASSPAIDVHQNGGLIELAVGTTQRVLTLGIPSVAGLTVHQARLILAREYARFSDRDASWTTLTYRIHDAVAETLAALRGIGWTHPWSAPFVWFNPARWLLDVYFRLYRVVTRSRVTYAERLAPAGAEGAAPPDERPLSDLFTSWTRRSAQQFGDSRDP